MNTIPKFLPSWAGLLAVLCAALPVHAQTTATPAKQDVKFEVPIDLTHPTGVNAFVVCTVDQSDGGQRIGASTPVTLSEPPNTPGATVRDVQTVFLTVTVPGHKVLAVSKWNCWLARTDGLDQNAYKNLTRAFAKPSPDRLLAEQTGPLTAN